MKVRLCNTLLFVVIFLISVSTVFASTRAFSIVDVEILIDGDAMARDAKIGSVVEIRLHDPDAADDEQKIVSADVDFRNLIPTGPAAEPMIWDPVLLKWVATYTVPSGVTDAINRFVIVSARFANMGTASIVCNSPAWLMTVNNIPPDLTGLAVLATVQDAGDNDVAIIGSTIVVEFEFAGVASATVDFSPFGGPDNQVMTNVGDLWSATYLVIPGNEVGTYDVDVVLFLTGNPNSGSVTATDQITINNVLPEASHFVSGYLASGGSLTSIYYSTGQALHVIAEFNSIIHSVEIDWARTFSAAPFADPIKSYILVNGILNIQFTPEEAAIVYGVPLQVYIISMSTSVGNTLTFAPGDEIVLELNSEDNPIEPVQAPSLSVNDKDLYYNAGPNGILRFSPESEVLAEYPDTTPDELEFFLKLENWNPTAIGMAPFEAFKIRFEFEGRHAPRFRTFEDGVEVTSDGSGNLTVIWDGKDDNGDYLPEGNWGMTLWEIRDAIGNVITLSDRIYDDVTGEHPYYPCQLGNGYVILNRMHVIIDNTPIGFVQDLDSPDVLNFTRYTDNYSFTGDMPAAPYTNTTYENDHTLANFGFQAMRQYLSDHNPLRTETGEYWIVLEDTVGGDKWYWTGATWADYAGMTETDLNFPAYSVEALPVSFNWDATIGDDGDPFAPSTYELVVYTRDRAGNVGTSAVKTIVLNEVVTDHVYDENLAHITAVEVLNEHDDNGGLWLSSGRPGTPNFYLSAGDYYTSQDHIEIEITVNNSDYLRANDSVMLDLTSLGLGEVFIDAADFVANKYTYTISNDDVKSITTDKAGLWTVGGTLPVYAYSTYTDPDLEVQTYSSPATTTSPFNLVVPVAPVWPELDDAVLTLGDTHISPGSYGNVYHAETNPAFDGVLDFTTLEIYVPSSSEPLVWSLSVKNSINNRIRSWNGSLAPGADHTATYNFIGRDNNLDLMVGALEEQALEVKLIVTPTALADPGYEEPPAPLTVTETLTVDNINPKFVSGDGVTVSPTTVIDLGYTPVVSGLANKMNFVVYTSEALEGPIFKNRAVAGWTALVVDANGAPITAPALDRLPAADDVEATVTVVSDLSENGVYAYELEVEIDNISGDFTYENAILVLRLPADNAGNPGRKNNPAYPYGADVFHKDSSEGFLTFHILNAKHEITKLGFQNHKSIGLADFNDSINDVQGYVSDGDFLLGAWIDGGIYQDVRSIVTNFKADLSEVLGVGYEAVAPDSVFEYVDRTANEDKVWILYWQGNIPAGSFANHLEDKELTVFVETESDGTSLYAVEKSIIIKTDIMSPVVVEAPTFIETGTYNIEYDVIDADAGIDWLSVQIETNEIDIVVSNIQVDDVNNKIAADLTTPLDTEIQNFELTLTFMDNVENETVDVRYVNILPTPEVTNVVINNGFTHFKPGTDVDVHFDIEFFERVEEIKIELTAPEGYSRVINLVKAVDGPFTANETVTFTNVDIPHLDVLTATVKLYTMQYTSSTDAASLALTEVSVDDTDVIADGVAPAITYNGIQELTTGVANILSYTITDPDAGVDWATAQLSFDYIGADIAIVGPVQNGDDIEWEVTVDPDTDLQMVQATVTIDDFVVNTGSLTNYLNVRPIPVISNVLVQDITQVPANTDWWAPNSNHELQVSFDVSNHQRASEIYVELSYEEVRGTEPVIFGSKTLTIGQILANNEVIFVDADIFDVRLLAAGELDGKIIRATVTGITHSYDLVDSDVVVPTPLDVVDNYDEINVDTKPVIQTVKFYLNAAATETINYLRPNMDGLKVVVTVASPNDLVTPVITLPVGGDLLIDAPVYSWDPVEELHVYTYYNVEVQNLDYDADTLFDIASFKVDTATIYGYHADQYNNDILVIGEPVYTQYGVINERNFSGIAPDGWFAPEHDLITKYTFISTVDNVVAPIIADFDRIEDNVPENWRSPDETVRTPITITLDQGGVPVSFDVFEYLATWVIQPDYQSVWSAYQDGEEIQVDYLYQQFNGEIADFTMVKVDKEVPTYDQSRYSVAVAIGDDDPNLLNLYQIVNSPVGGTYRTINLLLTPPAPGTFGEDKHVYLRVRAVDKDFTSPWGGVGVGWIDTPVVDGWTVAPYGDLYEDSGYYYQQWKLTPIDHTLIDNLSQVVVRLGKVEDLVGHSNYDGSTNPHSNYYRPVGPTITFNFMSGDNDGSIASIKAYQKQADPFDEVTRPYIKPNAELGLQLKLEQVQQRVAEVSNVRPFLVEINTPRATSVADNNWVALDRVVPGNDYEWYLNAAVPVVPAPADMKLGLNYKITYEIEFADNSKDYETYESAWINSYEEDGVMYDLILIDRTSPAFAVNGVVVKSTAYPSVNDNYVIPGYETELFVRFTDESNYFHAGSKPSVEIDHLNTFLVGIASPYVVDPDDISYDEINDIWTAHVTGLLAIANPGITSQQIVVRLADVVGNPAVSATKFVEIAAQGPIVPIIRDAKLITSLWNGAEVDNFLVPVPVGQSVPARVEIYIDTQYQAYIDEVWVDAIAGIDIPAVPNQIRPAAVGEPGKWVAVFNVVPTEALAGAVGDVVTFTVHTKREPYGQGIFNQTESFDVIIDGSSFVADQPLVHGIGVNNEPIDLIINPDLPMVVSATIHDLGELLGDVVLPDNATLAQWFELQNIAPELLDELLIPAAVVSDDNASKKVVWNIPADAINALDLESNLRISYKNIYGLEKTIDVHFYIDTVPPVIEADGIKFATNGAVTEYSYNPIDAIAVASDWTNFRVYLTDPEIMAGIAGSDISYAKLQLVPRAATYQATAQMQALAAYTTTAIIVDGTDKYLELSLSNVMAGFTSYDLAIGYYDIIVETYDKLENEVTYTQAFYYNPAETSIILTPFVNGLFELNTSEESKVLHALVNDPTGTVNGVHFRLYYDADADGQFDPAIDPEYTNMDIIPSVGGNPDMIPPFEAQWDFTNVLRYNWTPDANYDTQDIDGVWTVGATRQFLLRVTAISQSRYITDSFQVVDVTDDIAPVPNNAWAEYNNAPVVAPILYDHQVAANNQMVLKADFVNWPDARFAQFEITKLDARENTLVLVSDELVNPTDVASVVWNYNVRNDATGEYKIVVKGIDFVGNILSDADAISFNVTISNPASTVAYAIAMHNIIDLHNQPQIISPAFYGGTVNPVTNINNLRLNAGFNHLNGIRAIRFRAEKVDNATGLPMEDLVVFNNPAFQMDYVIDANGWISADQIVVHDPANPKAYIFVPADFYQTNPTEDFTYRFYVELEPEFAVSNPLFVDYAELSIDNRAPQLDITDFTALSSWTYPADFKVEGNEAYDINDINFVGLEWSLDGAEWNTAIFAPADVIVPTVDDFYYTFKNWNVAGGSINTFLGDDFHGEVQVRIVATDAMGNAYSSVAVLPVVDNKAPVTHFTHVTHSVNYPTLHPVNAGDVIEVVSSTNGNGSSNLQLFVDASTLDADAVMPLMMYHQLPNGNWLPVAYDHEAWNMGNQANPNLYEFVVPAGMLVGGTHNFVLVAKDALGNLEGDVASELVAYDAFLSNLEKVGAIDLTVNVISIDDIVVDIVSPSNLTFISGTRALSADTDNNAVVEAIRFEHFNGSAWQVLDTIDKAQTHELNFELKRSDIPQYDGMPWVPGVHLFANGVELTEMAWDAVSQSWKAANVALAQGVQNFQYGIDVNNDGIITVADDMILCPKGFNTLNVTNWVLPIDTNLYAQGMHEFRAIPLDVNGDELPYYQSNSLMLMIDNLAPVINNITAVGNIQVTMPGVNVPFATDIDELLVASDDIVEVTYQYSGQPNAAVNRKWNLFPGVNTTADMAGNYPLNWLAVNPLTDGIDNNLDGLVDEALEADGYFYIRAIARDKAGNFSVSNEYMIKVDGSPARMVLTKIDNVVLAENNYIFTVPAGVSEVTLHAEDITSADFDPATIAVFEYKVKASYMDPWPVAWTQIGLPVEVNRGAQIAFDVVGEAYYQFRVIATDTIGNLDPNPAVTSVIFNDVTGPGITFTGVGTRPVISEEFAFANDADDFMGNLTILLADPADVNTVTFEYSTTEIGPWYNIATTAVIPPNGIVSVAWQYPNLRAPLLYVRAIAQDAGANNMETEVVKLYLDTTPPSIDVVSLTHGIVNIDKKVLDKTEDIDLEIAYLIDAQYNFVDVASIEVRLNNGIVLPLETYTQINDANTDFVFEVADLTLLPDAIYHLEFVVTDFAGNVATIVPADYEELYIDTTAPQGLNLVAVNHPNNVAVYTDAIEFRVDYTDLIGVSNADAFTATFTYQNISQIVSTYTLADDHILFTWDPSAAFEQMINDGMMNLVVSAEVKVTDFLGNEGTFVANNFFSLTYGVPANVRMMAVTDEVYGAPRVNYVNWNLPTPQIVDMLGTNRTPGAAAADLTLYAYVPHLSEIPNDITFQYRKVGDLNFTDIATVANGNPWNFVDPNFLGLYAREYSANWSIVNLPAGQYEIKTIASYPVASSESVINVHIYDGLADTIIPQVSVNMDGGIVQRGETYQVSAAGFDGNAEFLDSVVYQYRYVQVDNNIVTPVSQWMYFGDNNGVEQDAWLPTPYTFDWSVYPYYLYNNKVQIVGYAKDKWGTETPITQIINSGNYVIAHITDTIAPAIRDITVTWDGKANPAWISGVIDNAATVRASVSTNVNPNDIATVEFYFDDVLIGTYTPASGASLLVTGNYAFEVPAGLVNSGVIKIVAKDVYNNVNEVLTTINIDNELPMADLLVSLDGTPVTTLERETTVVLDAQATDAPSGVATVAYLYRNEAVAVWTPIEVVNNAPFTAEWIVPANLIYGDTYIVKATVTDMVGHVYETEAQFIITDIDTEIQIITVAGHAPVNGIIPVRLHGDIPVVTNVISPQIPRLEFLIRAAGSDDWRILDPAYLTAVFDYTAVINLDELPTGNYELGVAPHGRRNAEPVDYVLITLDNDLNVNIVNAVPASNGFFNGEEFVVQFSVLADGLGYIDNINAANVELFYEYPAPLNGDWTTLGNAASISTLNGVDYTATFTNIAILHNNVINNGIYNFAIRVRDNALPTANVADIAVAQNVVYDTIDPNVAITSINGVTNMNAPITIALGTNVALTADAYDILSGQIVEVASGIERLEFYYQFGTITNLIGTDMTAPFEMNWNTLGYQTGAYTIHVVAYDNAGNETMVSKAVSIVAPEDLEPYALITAMNFDADNANADHIYAVTKTWNGETISSVAFEYTTDGNNWLEFTQAVNMGTYYRAQFNAELMQNVQKIRTVVTYNTGMISSLMPELAVSFSAEQGGSLVTAPAIQTELYYNHKINVMNAMQTPIVTTLKDGVFVNMPAVQIVNGDFEAAYTVTGHAMYSFWAAALDNDGNIQLAKATLPTYNVGTVSSDDAVISVTVPNNSYVYFQNVKNPIAVPAGFTALSTQKAVSSNPAQNLSYTMALTAVPATEGTIVGMYHNGNQWITVAAVHNEVTNTVTFTAPAGNIFAVGQYTDVNINAMFSSLTPAYNDWTLANTQIKFFVYDGFEDGVYQTPAAAAINYKLYVDGLIVLNNVPANYANGFVTYNAVGLAAGEHTARLEVSKDGFTTEAVKTFFVETTIPVITATGSQLSIANRTISATIVDAETGIANAEFKVSRGVQNITIPMHYLTIAGDTYSYELTYDDLYALGYLFGGTSALSVEWKATNNLMATEAAQSVNYTVMIEGPAIAFTGFDNGYFLNPTVNTPLTFNVIVPDGRTIPQDAVEVDLYEITNEIIDNESFVYENLIQTMTLAPVAVNGNTYSYSLNFAHYTSPQATSVRMDVMASDNYGVTSFSEQTYVIDYMPPVVWALTPVGAAIDPEAFPVVYESAVLPYGTDVAIGVGFQDIPGFVSIETGEWWWEFPGFWQYGQDYYVYHTAASGINASGVVVSLNGTPITNGTVTNGTFVANAGMLNPGIYNVIASVPDNAGNVGSVSFSFTITGGAPTITFTDIIPWLNSTNYNDLNFRVESQNMPAAGGVVANIYTMPSGALLQGPITPTPTQITDYINDYTIALQAGVIPADQTGVRLEVTATDVWGGTSTSNQIYGIDNIAPLITIHTPVAGTEVTIGSSVSITATITDQVTARGAKAVIGSKSALSLGSSANSDRAGSGLDFDAISLTVVKPDGTPVSFTSLTGAIAETVTADQYGTYSVTIRAADMVENQSVSSTNFIVPAPAPSIAFNQLDGNTWWLNTINDNALTFTVESADINIAQGGVIANVYTLPSNTMIQGPVTPTPVAGVYTVVVMGGVIPANQTGVRLEVSATNVLGGTSSSTQLYGIDNMAPQIVIQSPQADAQFALNNTVNFMATISDLAPVRSGVIMANTNARNEDKSAGSGIARVGLKVIGPNGSAVVDTMYYGNIQVLQNSMVVEAYGSYTAYITAFDNTGNQGISTVNFMTVTGSAPTITFNEIVGTGWWLNNTGTNSVTFEIQSAVGTTVSAELVALPANELIAGPMQIVPVNGIYSVNIDGTSIPAGSSGIKMAITVADIFGFSATYSQIFNVDRVAPTVTVFSPQAGAEFVLVDAQTQVEIKAEFADLTAIMSKVTKNQFGSGIGGARLTMTKPDNSVSVIATVGEGAAEITATLDNLMIGTYAVSLTVWDKAGNQNTQSTSFNVVAQPEPPVIPETLAIRSAHIYPNPMSTELGANFRVDMTAAADLTIKIYDFAGREVRTINQYAASKSAVDVSWDGRNNSGQKLARGAYFARVIANDGKKIVEKVVKVAITK